MHDRQRDELKAQALGDQLVAALKEDYEKIVRVAGKEPSTWSDTDRMIAWMCVNAVGALLAEGRL